MCLANDVAPQAAGVKQIFLPPPGTPEIAFLRVCCVYHSLCVGNVVAGRDAPVDYAELLMHYLHHRGEAIGRA